MLDWSYLSYGSNPQTPATWEAFRNFLYEEKVDTGFAAVACFLFENLIEMTDCLMLANGQARFSVFIILGNVDFSERD